MSIILGALGGAGQALESVYGERMRADLQRENAMAENEQRSNLETQRMMTLEAFRNKLQNAPLDRFAALVQQKAGEQVPVEAAPVTTASGQDPQLAVNTAAMDNPITSGMVGNYADLIAKAKDLPPEDQQPYLDQLKRQFVADQATAQAAVAGQTRARTSDEAFNAALEEAKVRDPVAYAAARPLAADKTITVADGAAILDARTGKLLYQNNGKEDRQEAREDRRDERQQKAIEAAGARQDKAIAAAIAATSRKHDLQEEVTPQMEVTARAIANGQVAPLTGYALRSPGAQAIMARVLEINPEFSATDFLTKSKAERDFATGKQGNSVRSFNVAIDHLNTLSQLAVALDNRDTQLINKLGNTIASQTGSEAPTNFETAKHIVADEIVKAVTGSGGALGDREAAAKTISSANSPAQLLGTIKVYQDLMNGQLNGLRHQYEASTGRKDFDEKYLSDAARAMNHSSAAVVARGSAPAIPMPSDISDLLGKYGGK